MPPVAPGRDAGRVNTLSLADVREPVVSRRRRVGYGAVAVGSLLVVGYAAMIVASGFRLLPAEVADNRVPGLVWAHVVFAAVALLLMPVQVSGWVRRRHVRVHRLSGRVYAGCAVLGGGFGALAAVTTANGVVVGAGFLTLGVLWVASTVAAVVAARERRLDDHRRWALRSAALVFAAVTLRLEIGLGVAITGASFAVVYSIVAWLCWIPNLLVAERLIRRGPR